MLPPVPALPTDAQFQNTGLERSAALAADLQWFESTYGIKAPTPQEDGPGRTYVRLLQELAQNDPPAYICHYYNYYFAHTAGGRMIGKKVGVHQRVAAEHVMPTETQPSAGANGKGAACLSYILHSGIVDHSTLIDDGFKL